MMVAVECPECPPGEPIVRGLSLGLGEFPNPAVDVRVLTRGAPSVIVREGNVTGSGCLYVLGTLNHPREGGR